jgi:hypothetical protein
LPNSLGRSRRSAPARIKPRNEQSPRRADVLAWKVQSAAIARPSAAASPWSNAQMGVIRCGGGADPTRFSLGVGVDTGGGLNPGAATTRHSECSLG